jgi:ATP-dependent DNA helicase RecG
LVGEAPDRAAADAIRRGEAHIVFGTPALLDADVSWRRLGLVVAEERSPYGDVTRDRLADMPHQPDLLVVTRTPIPSSLVFTVFGDFDVSVVSAEEPLTVTSLVHKAGEREAAYEQARAAVDAGKQAFVVFPVREGKDLLGRADALRMAKALQGDGFPGARIGIYSSEMSREERTRVFDDFQHRRVDVLVCTTYIEDSPSVANATVMVVEYADLHDLVRLHRLRGHVGQGWASGVCHYILSDSPAEGDIQRVNTVTSERDGFRLAEIDLEVRGHEALLGDRADEMPEMRWAEPTRDRHLLLRARTEAFRLLQRDPGLRRSKALARAVHHRWGDWLDRVLPVPDQKRLGATDSKKGRRRRRRRRR